MERHILRAFSQSEQTNKPTFDYSGYAIELRNLEQEEYEDYWEDEFSSYED